MHLNRLVNQIWEELSGFAITDDTRITYEYLRDKIIGFNVSLIREQWEKKLPLDPYMRLINCLEINREGFDCTINGIHFEKKHGCMYSSDVNHLVDVGYDNISYLGVHGISTPFSRKDVPGFLESNSHPYPKNVVFLLIGDKIIYRNLPDSNKARFGSMIALFEDVTKCCNWPSDDADEFPTPSIQKLTFMVKRDIMASGAPDLIHDAQGPLGQQPKQSDNRGNEE